MVYITFAPDSSEEADIARLGAVELRGPSGVTAIADWRSSDRDATSHLVVQQA